MQDMRKRTIILCTFTLILLTVVLVLFCLRKQDVTDFALTDTDRRNTLGLVTILQKVLKAYVPAETIDLEISEENEFHLSAEFTKENLREISERYDIPIRYLSPFLPDLITGNLDLRFTQSEDQIDVSVLRFEIAEIDLTEFVGAGLSEAISQAVNNGMDSIGFHSQFT